MTVIVLPAADDPEGVAPGPCEHAVATNRATKAKMARDLVDRAI
jgi:hypothetical protein